MPGSLPASSPLLALQAHPPRSRTLLLLSGIEIVKPLRAPATRRQPARRRRHGRPGDPPLSPAEDWFQGRHGRARDGEGHFDYGPEVDQDAIPEGVRGEGVGVDGMQADDGGDCRERAHAKDEEEGIFLFGGPVDGAEGLDGEEEDEDVC